MGRRIAVMLVLASMAGVGDAADAEPEFQLVVKDHRFTPEVTTVPASQKIRLIIENQDPTPEEFESHALNREKIVPAGGKIVVFVGPLKPGRYEYYGEFHADTARGWLVAAP